LEALIVIPIIVGLAIWFWFVLTLNGIHKQLKNLNLEAQKQIEFLDYISDQIAHMSGQKIEKDK
jgi:hypothetical protein